MTIKKTRLSDEEAQAAAGDVASEAEIVVPGVRETSSLHGDASSNNNDSSSSPLASSGGLEPDIVVKPSAKKLSSLEVEQDNNGHDALATNIGNLPGNLPSAFYCPITKRIMVSSLGPRNKRMARNPPRRAIYRDEPQRSKHLWFQYEL